MTQKEPTYNFSLDSEGSVSLKHSNGEQEEHLTIPAEDMLIWLTQLDDFLGQIGIKPLLSKRSKKKSNDGEESYMTHQQKLHQQAYAKWTEEADAELKEMYQQDGFTLENAAEHFERNLGSIKARLKKLGLVEI